MKEKKIFIIDDDEISIFLLKELLLTQSIGDNVFTFLFAEKALEEIRIALDTDPAQLPDIIFLDLSMPQMSGWNFLDSLRFYEDRMKGKCVVYIMTSAIDISEYKRSSEYKLVGGYFNKPIEMDALDIIRKDIYSR
ncbi:two-component system response regulator [Pontibacter sp. SGAir0037]|uniref:response regulator n=1 Tax=Pontibacter sp. SGAir0037 TaxID=2571030 RepID=UPI0010CD16C2|nr:response regulator [Pontibacter sp. SGAir0037]QCR21838.1 hypothetical protein C1N53_05460 [Pontibacter sp. SGAir0037]